MHFAGMLATGRWPDDLRWFKERCLEIFVCCVQHMIIKSNVSAVNTFEAFLSMVWSEVCSPHNLIFCVISQNEEYNSLLMQKLLSMTLLHDGLRVVQLVVYIYMLYTYLYQIWCFRKMWYCSFLVTKTQICGGDWFKSYQYSKS